MFVVVFTRIRNGCSFLLLLTTAVYLLCFIILGVARQRKAIVDGLRESVGDFQEAIHEMSAKDVLELVERRTGIA